MEGDASWNAKSCAIEHFNPLPPHGGRLNDVVTLIDRIYISIHSLRMEGDQATFYFSWRFCISIHSLRMEGDIVRCFFHDGRNFISIHSLRMEGDALSYDDRISNLHFNPLPPHGGRQTA